MKPNLLATQNIRQQNQMASPKARRESYQPRKTPQQRSLKHTCKTIQRHRKHACNTIKRHQTQDANLTNQPELLSSVARNARANLHSATKNKTNELPSTQKRTCNILQQHQNNKQYVYIYIYIYIYQPRDTCRHRAWQNRPLDATHVWVTPTEHIKTRYVLNHFQPEPRRSAVKQPSVTAFSGQCIQRTTRSADNMLSGLPKMGTAAKRERTRTTRFWHELGTILKIYYVCVTHAHTYTHRPAGPTDPMWTAAAAHHTHARERKRDRERERERERKGERERQGERGNDGLTLVQQMETTFTILRIYRRCKHQKQPTHMIAQCDNDRCNGA